MVLPTLEVNLITAVASQGLAVAVSIYLINFVTRNLLDQMRIDRENAQEKHRDVITQMNAQFTKSMSETSEYFCRVLNKLDSNEKQYLDTCRFIKDHDKQAGVILSKLDNVEKNTTVCLQNHNK
jgi:protein-arginine kinase